MQGFQSAVQNKLATAANIGAAIYCKTIVEEPPEYSPLQVVLGEQAVPPQRSFR